MLSNAPTRWWMLQIEFPEIHPGQGHLLSQPLPRQELLRRSFEFIPSLPRIFQGDSSWGLADVQQVDDNIMVANLTVRPPAASIAEEPMPGLLEEANEPRFFTPVVLHLSLQILAVQRTPEVGRYARSAKKFALIIGEFLEKALEHFKMSQFYLPTVEAIAEKGSFSEWYSRLEHLDSITVHYIGKNLPARPDGLIHSLRKHAEEFKNDMRSESVDLVAKNPSLTDQDIDEIDKAIADRRLKIRARGTCNGVGMPWSSKDKPVPKAALVEFNDQEASSLSNIGSKIGQILQQILLAS